MGGAIPSRRSVASNSMGLPIALVPMPNALAATEVQAFEVLTGVKAVAFAAGGVGGSEGTTVLSLMGEAAQVEKAMASVRAIKGEPPTHRPAARVTAAAASFEYDAMEQWRVQADDAKWHIPAGFGR
jgi:hypothetical protein